MSSGADISKALSELWLCKEIPRSCYWEEGIKEHHVCNLIQKDFTYSGKNRAREGLKERKGKIEQEREREKKERRMKAKY